jgi:F-type H+-transporting ATPase subunit delta
MSVVARRYAQAVFELARDAGTLAASVKQLQALAAAYDESPELGQLDQLPQLDDGQRASIAVAVAKRVQANTTVERVVQMLAERKRLSILPEMAAVVAEMADEHEGVIRATVTSARPLGAGYVKKLAAQLETSTGRKVVVTTQEDPQLLAGVVTQIGDRVIDGSVRGRLDRLARSLRQN